MTPGSQIAPRTEMWCRGEATRWGGNTVMPFAANVAVEIGGVCVIPGDYLYADASGAVVIPRPSLRRVIDEALTIEAADARSLEQIAAEQPNVAPPKTAE
jgi:regulator of RNase E activity RraA